MIWFCVGKSLEISQIICIMHIKQITISGFKSYKEAVVLDDISPKHNLVCEWLSRTCLSSQ